MNEKDKTLLNKLIQNEAFTSFFSNDYHEDLLLIRFDASQNIIKAHQELEYLYFMFSGRCKVIAYSQNGKKMILSSLKAPCLIGEIELISQRQTYIVDALEDCLMIAIPLKKYKEKLLSDPHFLLQLSISLAEKEGKAMTSYIHNISYPLINRLARFILDNIEGNTFSIRKTVIAESLGVSYRHLEAVLSDMVRNKILEKHKLTYTIKDRNRLKKLSQVLDIDSE